jgi:threonine dehydratase
MRFADAHYKIVVDPGSAVGIAAVLASRIVSRNITIATVATGGNIDRGRFCALLNETDQDRLMEQTRKAKSSGSEPFCRITAWSSDCSPTHDIGRRA